MCGIAGIFHLQTAKPVDAARVRAMTGMLAQRGPDHSGEWTAPGVGLGHCRLAVTDLAGGAQPMVTEDGVLVTIVDGKIYNFIEVRSDLERLGHVFRTASDTEVILHGWRQWGPACLSRFRGMFAFALYDGRAGTLFLARDRLGLKPLYYAELSDGALIFASELKGLLAHPLLRRSPDPAAIDDYLALGYVPDDACLVAGVRKLPAGHHLTLLRGMPLPRPIQWWDISFADRASGGAAALEEQLVTQMRDAVRAQMIADVPVGAFLSGGVDSSAVVALMAEASREAVQTRTIGFDEADHDETRYAAMVAERFATEHRTGRLAAADFGLIDRLVEVLDEPFADPSALPAYRLCELARETLTVALSGDGVDETFAGHRRHGLHATEERIRRLLPAALRARAFGPLGALARSGEEAYADAVGVIRQAARHRLYSAEAKRLLGGYRAEDRYVTAMRAAPARDPLDRAQYADLKIRLPGDILARIDRTGMAVGLEIRQPFLDHRLVEFAARLPAPMRLRRGTGKWLMRRAMRRYLPGEILNRPSMSFEVPVSAGFRGPLAVQASSIAHGSALAETGWFDSAVLERIAAEHSSGRADHGRLLWQLVMLDRSLGRIFGLGRHESAQLYLASTK